MKKLVIALAAAVAFAGLTGSALAIPLHEHALTNTQTGASTTIGAGFCAHPDLFAHGAPLHDVFHHFHFTVHVGGGGTGIAGNADVAFTNPNNPVNVTLDDCPSP
jgi:hypothetical protein